VERRKCIRCKQFYRVNDPSYWINVCAEHTVWIGMGFPLGGYSVCTDCATELGLPYVRPLDHSPPKSDDPIGCCYCRACKRYVREDENPGKDGVLPVVRLLPEDVAGSDTPPGALMICRECRARWVPVVHARYLATGVWPPGTPLEVSMGNFNLV